MNGSGDTRGERDPLAAGRGPVRPGAARHSLCDACLHVRTVTSARGSVFLLCARARTDARFPKYPPQPVARCEGFEPAP